MFTVVVKFRGQAQNTVPGYTSRRTAARAAAMLLATTRPDGRRPSWVGIREQPAVCVVAHMHDAVAASRS